MKVCEYCGKRYSPDKEGNEYNYEFGMIFPYRKISRSLCCQCATDAFHNMEEGIFIDTCICCNQTFDLMKEEQKFSNTSTLCDAKLRYFWSDFGIVCAECALEKIDERNA